MANSKIFNQWLIASAIAVFVFAVFYPALHNDFVRWDDESYFLDNQNYRGLAIANLKWTFVDSYKTIGMYIPLAWLTWSADYVLWGMNPFGYHLTNIIIHSLTAGSLYFLAYWLLSLGFNGTARDGPLKLGAAFAALLWAIHPLRVESVVWITERKDVLCGLFFVLTLLAYIYYTQTKKRAWYWYTLVLAFCALLSKPIAVSIPIVLIILDFYPLRRLGGRIGLWSTEARQIYMEKIPFSILSLATSAFTFWANYNFEGVITARNYLSLGDRLLVISYGLRFYLEKMLVPINLAPLYALGKLIDLRNNYIFHYSLGVGLLLVVLSLRRRFPAVFVTFLFFLATLLPVSGIAQAGPQIAADRFTYIPSMGWALLAGCALAYIWQFFSPERPNAGMFTGIVLLAVVILFVLSVLTWKQINIWQNAKTIWTHTVLISPDSYLAHFYLGNEMLKEGNINGAIDQYKLAIAITPNDRRVYFNLANAYVSNTDFPNAEYYYQLLIQNDPSFEPAWINLGVTLFMAGRADRAIDIYEQVLKINPEFLGVKDNLTKMRNELKSPNAI